VSSEMMSDLSKCLSLNGQNLHTSHRNDSTYVVISEIPMFKETHMASEKAFS
jgi:hypothetical protein